MPPFVRLASFNGEICASLHALFIWVFSLACVLTHRETEELASPSAPGALEQIRELQGQEEDRRRPGGGADARAFKSVEYGRIKSNITPTTLGFDPPFPPRPTRITPLSSMTTLPPALPAGVRANQHAQTQRQRATFTKGLRKKNHAAMIFIFMLLWVCTILLLPTRVTAAPKGPGLISKAKPNIPPPQNLNSVCVGCLFLRTPVCVLVVYF